MNNYLLALDQGTTSSRAILFDTNQRIVALAQREFTQIYPKEGWVEHDPMEIWSSQYSVVTELLAKSGIDPHEIVALGITNQRETTIVWDKQTGRPIYNAIVWQCRRTAPMIESLVKQGLSQKIQEKTGLVPDAYFSASKLSWILDLSLIHIFSFALPPEPPTAVQPEPLPIDVIYEDAVSYTHLITREQAALHPQKNLITRALGVSANIVPEYNLSLIHIYPGPVGARAFFERSLFLHLVRGSQGGHSVWCAVPARHGNCLLYTSRCV